jgi:hypothetical protein
MLEYTNKAIPSPLNRPLLPAGIDLYHSYKNDPQRLGPIADLDCTCPKCNGTTYYINYKEKISRNFCLLRENCLIISTVVD